MLITIELQNDSEMQWLAPLVEAMKNANVQVNILEKSMPHREKKFSDFLDFLKNNKKPPISKITIPSREDRNER